MHYSNSPTGLVVLSSSPWKTLREFVQYAKENPGKVTYSTSGAGSNMHMAMLYIAKREGIEWTHVPFQGGKPALMALLGSHVTAHSGSTAWAPYVREGSVRLLATHGEKRMKTFPDVPTFHEMGYDFVSDAVFMIAAPKGTPLPIVRKLDDAFRKAMDAPEFIQTMKSLDLEGYYRNHEDLKRYLEEAYERMGKMIVELEIPTEFKKK